MSARDEVLGRIRSALGEERPALEPLGAATADDTRDLAARFTERVEDYRAVVQVVRRGASGDSGGSVDELVAEAVRAACERAGAQRVGVPEGFATGWVPESVEAVAVAPGARADLLRLADLDAMLTHAPLGIAETGTIVLDAGPGQGPRAGSLLPDILVVVIDAGALVGGVTTAVARMKESVLAGGRPLTMISGPSATSDIELDRVEGVHGPRTLEVVLVDGPR